MLLSIAEPGEKQNKQLPKRKLALGIDLGTTNSLVATCIATEDSSSSPEYQPQTLADAEGNELLPSVVHYQQNDIKQVGESALSFGLSDPGNTIFSVKRLMGRGLEDINYDLAYQLVSSNEGGMPLIRTSAGDHSPVKVSADILSELAARGEQALGGKPEGVVITVPAYFDEAQRQATKDAARIANLNVLRLLSEPTAAAVAYGLDKKLEGTVIIYDLGGGTFDVSLMRLQKGIFEVLATGGDAALGGDDFDRSIMQWLIQETGVNTPLEPAQLNRFMSIAKTSKHALTEKKEVEIKVDDWQGLLTRDTLNALVSDLIDKTIKACRRVLRDAKLKVADVTDVVMVGGSTRSPLVREKVAEFFKQEVLTNIDPDKVVALGAAIQADILVGNKYGDDLLLLDVIPLSLGIETMGGLLEKIIPRNTTIPVARAQEFTTFKDGQSIMSLHVLQGERELITECRSLARFDLRDIPPMVAGAARIKVTFQVDADGLMEVKAEELSSGVESSVVVKPSFGLADKDVEQMIKSSYESAQSDKEMRNLREAQVEGLRIVEALETALASDGNILSLNDFTRLSTTTAELKQLVESDNVEEIKQLSIDLNDLSVDFAAKRMNSQIKVALEGKQINELEN